MPRPRATRSPNPRVSGRLARASRAARTSIGPWARRPRRACPAAERHQHGRGQAGRFEHESPQRLGPRARQQLGRATARTAFPARTLAPTTDHADQHARPRRADHAVTTRLAHRSRGTRPRLHPDRDPGRAADPRDHVRARLRDLSRRAHLRRAHRGGAQALARNRVRHAHAGHGFRANGAAPGARSARSDPHPRAAWLFAATAPARASATRLSASGSALGSDFQQQFDRSISTRTPASNPASADRAPPRPARGAHARRLVEHGGAAARHPAASVLRPGRRCAEAQLHHRARHRAGHKPQIQDLFSGVKTVQLRYLDGNQTWQTQWPPPNLPSPENLWTRPVAVEITIEFKDWGRVQPADRGGRMSGRRAPSRARAQRGVALIIALILVALAAILATKLSFDGWLERRRTIGIIATEQAFQFGMGAEALAADVLNQSTKPRRPDRTDSRPPTAALRTAPRARLPPADSNQVNSGASLGAAHAALAHHPPRTIPRGSRSAPCRARSRTCRAASI